MQQLSDLGFDDYIKELWQQGNYEPYIAGRVIADYGNRLHVATPEIYIAGLAGKLAHDSKLNELPKVGDWVAVQLAESGESTVHAVLPRRSEVGRKVPGKKQDKQVLAANVDMAFIVQALDDDFSRARLERYVYQLKSSNIEPVFVFNKSDKLENPTSKLQEVEDFNIRYIITSAKQGIGLNEIVKIITAGKTAVFLGSSGVGKSTLTNRLLGRDIQKTAEIRERDSTGKHTTSHRELFVMPNGGLIIDTPGIRELQLWGDLADLKESFPLVAKLASDCKFSPNCRHTAEPGCKIQEAISSGRLSLEVYKNYQKLKQELYSSETDYTAKTKNSKVADNREDRRLRKHRHYFDDDGLY